MSGAIVSASTLEHLSHLATVILVGGLFIAWSNVRALNRDSRLRLDRSAKEKAIEAAAMYLGDAVSQFDEIYKRDGDRDYAEYKGAIGDFTPQSLSKSDGARALKKFRVVNIHNYLNTLELIAAHFVTGVADEKEGFRIIGRSFCGAVEGDYDIISSSRVYPGHPYWYNIVSLYKIWRPRLKDTEVRSTLEHLEGLASKLRSKAGVP